MHFESGQSLQSSGELHSGSSGGNQLISISKLSFNVISEWQLNSSVLEALHRRVMLNGSFSFFRVLEMIIGELKLAFFSWITNFDLSGSMLLTR